MFGSFQVGAAIRKRAFFALDAVKGHAVARHLAEMDSPEFDIRLRDQRLSSLLAHAKRTTAFYSAIRGGTLAEFPVVSKELLKQRFGEFRSSRYGGGKLIEMTTSGSTGMPFTFLLTPEKKNRQRAEVIHYGRWSGYYVGTKHAYVRVNKTKGQARLWMQNEVAMDPTSVADEQFAPWCERLMRGDIRVIIGYVSAIRALGDFCLGSGVTPSAFGLRGVITSSETLFDDAREAIERAFGCQALSRYSTQEFGVLANECPEARRHHINCHSYIVEILKTTSDEPAREGEVGRVVVTDLFSHAMPLIRYDTGDLSSVMPPCSCGRPGPTLGPIHGRLVERIYDSLGRPVSPFAINAATVDLRDVVRYRFVQQDERKYCMYVVVGEKFGSRELIRERLVGILGHEASISIEKVTSIPRTAAGKQPYICNEWRAPGPHLRA